MSVDDGTGTRSFAYDARGRLTSETNALAVIAREYNALGLPSGFAADSDDGIAYAYDGAGRMTNVCFGALSFCHGYLPHTRHLESVSNSCGIGWRRVYEGERNLIASVTNFSGAATVAAFSYMNDALGRRVVRNGDTFAYNARSELTNAVMNANAYGYGHDGIGNLLFFAAGTVTNAYMANALNQYALITGGATASPIYDPDGNMLTNGVWSYTWDAENRLVGAANNQTIGITCAYDYQGRRFRKSSVSATNTFLYDGWNLYREVESLGDTTVTNIYVWGPDLSGALQGAGGVGGLLAVLRNGMPYFPCYDANGNVTDYVDANGAVVAHREYDPFGRTNVATGPLVHDLHFWFSTKCLDEETGLYYYGERFYSPELMRWLNRDPIEERGGINLYAVCKNNMISGVDAFGLVYSIYAIRADAHLKTSRENKDYGHEWLEVGGNTFGWWPKGFVSGNLLIDVLFGVEGEINRGFPQDPYSSVKVVVTVWDTLQRKTGELHAGDNKGKKCKCASGSDIENCLKAFAGNYSGKWSLLRSCRTFSKEALSGCCLKKGRSYTFTQNINEDE